MVTRLREVAKATLGLAGEAFFFWGRTNWMDINGGKNVKLGTIFFFFKKRFMFPSFLFWNVLTLVKTIMTCFLPKGFGMF